MPAVMPLDVHQVNQANEHTESDTSHEEADSLFDEQCTDSSLEVD